MLFEKQIEAMYRRQLFTRYDDTGAVFYYSAADFPGLIREPFRFPANAGHMLQGYFYHYGSPTEGRLVVFDHGMGGGHRSYFKEIEMLARQGYLVFAYDHTGCMESDGASTNGFAQSVNDLDACLTALKKEPRCADCKISLVGHSWGAFAVLNAAAFHPDVRHIVALSGFVSVKRMVEQTFSGLLKGFRRHILSVETAANPDYAACDAVNALKNTDAALLVIHSEDDKVVLKAHHFDVLSAALSDRPNTRFLLLSGKGHNPNYTADAVAYKDAFFKSLTRAQKKKQLETDAQKAAFVAAFDWDRMTRQDEDLWQEIFKTLRQ